MSEIKEICVIGAGVMGAGIAAQAANSGARVLLLDVMEGAAETAVAKMLKSEPAPFMHKKFAQHVITGTTESDLDRVKNCDWIIEAIVENPKIKQELYASLLPHLKPDAIVSSNTSTLPLSILTEGMNEELKQQFMITHFFNPPRYMRLLEIVTSKETNISAVETLSDYCDLRMGKSIVHANDTPGFIANRVGTFWLHAAVTEAYTQNVGIEEADAVLGRPAGIPKTGIFGLLDLVGLDLMPHILSSLSESLPPSDPFHILGQPPELLNEMIEAGYTGRKGRGGFYRLNTTNGEKVKEVIDLQSGDYRPAKRPKIAAAKVSKKGGLRATLSHESKEGRYARSVLLKTLTYAASLIPEIADTPEAIDRAMRLGYNWKFGPFELIDKLGSAWFSEALASDGIPIPSFIIKLGNDPIYKIQKGHLQQFTLNGHVSVVRSKGTLLLQDVKRSSKPLAKNMSATLWDIGDNVACLEFTSKMNSINPFILFMIEKAIRLLPAQGFKALVIHNEGRNFSVGANIALLLYGAKFHLWPFVRWMLKRGQNAFQGLRYAPFPVIGAPSGMALGGGCEVLLHCDAIEAHAETYMGLIEAGVGIVPGWGGCKELLCRWDKASERPKGPMPAVMKAFETIALAQVAKSAVEARDLLFLRPDDNVVMNHDRVLASAKERALKMAENYQPPAPNFINLPGPTGQTALDLGVKDYIAKGVATPHDGIIAHELAYVLSGGDTDILDTVSEDEILKLEREAIDRLARTKKTKARVEHMLTKGKPLRN